MNFFCVAIKTNGTLWAWGRNQFGQLGLGVAGNYVNRSSPIQVGALTDWSKVSASSYMCAAIKTNGSLWAWGQGSFGQLGQNNTNSLSSPVQVGAGTNWSQVSSGSTICLAILN